jgi:hypothetical protein
MYRSIELLPQLLCGLTVFGCNCGPVLAIQSLLQDLPFVGCEVPNGLLIKFSSYDPDAW